VQCKPVKWLLMETHEYIRELRIVGGHVALDFVNTVDGEPDGETGFENLQSYGDLVAWSARVGVLSEEEGGRLAREAGRRPEEAEAVYHDALKLRDALYSVFRAVADGRDPSTGSLEILRQYECEALSRGRLAPGDHGFQWEWKDDDDLGKMLWSLAHAATGLLTSESLDRLKHCVGCHWLFLDESRNRSRRWCTMEVCGTHEKMRRYVAKRAARRSIQ
jgi:predicted RNA-binding Zn ribbon-like protein